MPPTPDSLHVGAPPLDWPHYGISFRGAVRRGFAKYATFRGRASNAEFWWWQLFLALVMLIGIPAISVLAFLVDGDKGGWLTTMVVIAQLVFYMAVIVPSLSLTVRRLHDSGHSGATYFLSWIPLVGGIILLVFLASGTSPRAHWYGPPEPLDGHDPSRAGDDGNLASQTIDRDPVAESAHKNRAGKVVACIVAVIAVASVAGLAVHLATQYAEGRAAGTSRGDSAVDRPAEAPSSDPFSELPSAGSDMSTDPGTSSSPIPPVVGRKPDRARACPGIHDLGLTPARSAVNAKTTTCEFAEEVRRAYVQSGQQGQPLVVLTDVYSPRTQKYYTMDCTGTDTVTCTGGVKAEVFLY